jgi:hypothetical protein
MVSHEREFRGFLAGLPSADRYVRFLHDVAETSGMSITPESLRSEADIDAFAIRLTSRYSAKSVSNYRSVMRKYVEMVNALRL